MNRRDCILSVLALGLPAAARAQVPLPKAVRIINQFGPGGGADAIVRPLVERVGADLDRPVTIEYRPGAAGAIAAAALEGAPADGGTLIIDTQTLSLNTMLRKVTYRHAEWEPVTLLGQIPIALLAGRQVPAATLQELVAHARANPEKLTYATLGPGSAAHLAALRFERLTDVRMRPVPYKGTTDVHQDLMGERVDLFFDGVPQALPRFRNAQLKLLAISANERMTIARDVPTFREAGVDLVATAWFGIAAPRGTPAEIVRRLNEAFVTASRAPDYRERMQQAGVIPVGSSVADFARFRKDDLESWGALIRRLEIQVE